MTKNFDLMYFTPLMQPCSQFAPLDITSAMTASALFGTEW